MSDALWFMIGWVACDLVKSLVLQLRRDLLFHTASEYIERVPRSRFFIVRWWRSYHE